MSKAKFSHLNARGCRAASAGAQEQAESTKPTWLSLSEAVDALADEMGIGFGSDGVGENPRARSELLAALADGRLSAEGIRAACRPEVKYESIPDAWWAEVIPDGLMLVHRGRMPAEPQEVTIVNFRGSAVRRTTGGKVVIYRSIRIRSDTIRTMRAGDSPIRIEGAMSPPTGRHQSEHLSEWPDFAGAYEGFTPIPLPQSLSLGEAAAYVARRCQVLIHEAQSGLERALREYSVILHDENTLKSIPDLRASKIDWNTSTVIGGEHLTINGIRYTARVHVYRRHLDLWMGKLASFALTAPPSAGPPDAIYRTGLPGKPTTWHLLESECRRRYAVGERYPNKSTGRESPSEWARALLTWVQSAHPGAPPPKPKTLTNHLSVLLRELEAGAG